MAELPPEQAAPAQPAAPAEGQAEGGGAGTITELIGSLPKMMALLQQAFAEGGRDDAAQAMQGVIDAYGQAVDMVSGDAGGAPGASDQMSGGNPNAKPMGPSGM